MTSPSETRGAALRRRMDALGITGTDLAAHAKIDRTTLTRALKDDPAMTERTWGRVEGAVAKLEEEIGMADSGHLVTTVIEYEGAKITVQGSPADVAETARRIIGEKG